MGGRRCALHRCAGARRRTHDPASSGRFRVGLRLWEVAALARRGSALRERALPFLEELSQFTRENVQLAVREGAEVVLVERIAGSGAVPLAPLVRTSARAIARAL